LALKNHRSAIENTSNFAHPPASAWRVSGDEMTAVDMGRAPATSVGRRFYLIMSLLMAAVFIGGFSQTVPSDFAPTPGLPLLLHVHGAVFTLWVLVFVAQPAFIARGSIKLHRQIGMVGAALAGAMVIMGVAATLFAIRYHLVPPFFPPGIFLVMNLIGILVFGALGRRRHSSSAQV
jgi:hypothetical protein